MIEIRESCSLCEHKGAVRAGVVAANEEALKQAIDHLLNIGEEAATSDFEVILTPINMREKQLTTKNVTLLCSGIGTEWVAMCSQLVGEIPLFRGVFEEWSALSGVKNLIDIACARTGDETAQNALKDIRIAQFGLAAFQIAMFTVLSTLIRIDGVCGFSAGEIPAAYICGLLTTRQAVDVARVMGAVHHDAVLAEVGRCVVVFGCSREEIATLMLENGGSDHVNLTAELSLKGFVVGGDMENTQTIADVCRERGHVVIFPENFVVPFHCAHVFEPRREAMRQEFKKALLCDENTAKGEKLPLYTSSIGGLLEKEDDVQKALFWSDAVCRTALSFSALSYAIVNHKRRLFVELNCKNLYARTTADALDDLDLDGFAISCEHKSADEGEVGVVSRFDLLRVVACLYVRGASLK